VVRDGRAACSVTVAGLCRTTRIVRVAGCPRDLWHAAAYRQSDSHGGVLASAARTDGPVGVCGVVAGCTPNAAIAGSSTLSKASKPTVLRVGEGLLPTVVVCVCPVRHQDAAFSCALGVVRIRCI